MTQTIIGPVVGGVLGVIIFVLDIIACVEVILSARPLLHKAFGFFLLFSFQSSA
jgi:hypothetical protein